MKFETHFSGSDLTFIAVGMLWLLVSIYLFSKNHLKKALLFLTLAGFTWRLWMAFVDPFLHSWDEQYHALVAKNMTHDFFHPMLVKDPLLPTEPSYWAFTQTWLHKPPFFMWLMALSIKVFGNTYWAIRIPSVILSALMIPAIYRSGSIIRNERTGYFAALIVATSCIFVNITSGYLNTDQNDVIFIALVCFSYWSWMESLVSDNKKWIVITALFISTAVLTKWLPGLLVLGTAGLHWLIAHRGAPKKLLRLFAIFGLSLIPLVFWFGYAAYQWPAEWAVTQAHYNEHFTKTFDHEGTAEFHLIQFVEQHSIELIGLVVLGITSIFFSREGRSILFPMIITCVGVFIFYTIVATKMPLFCAMTYPLLYLFSALSIDFIAEQIQLRWKRFSHALIGIALFLFSYSQLNVGRLEFFHTNRTKGELYRNTRLHNTPILQKFNGQFPPGTVVFNCPSWNGVATMYYTDYTCYDILPNEELLRAAQQQQRKVIVLDDGTLPEYIATHPTVTIIKNNLIRNGY